MSVERKAQNAEYQTYRALQKAAESVARYDYEEYGKQHRGMKKIKGYAYIPSQEQRDLVKASQQVLDGEMPPEEAVGLLWTFEIQRKRGVLAPLQKQQGPIR